MPSYATWLSLAAGLAYPLAFAPFGLAPLAILSIAALLLLCTGTSPRMAARRGFVWGVGAYLGGLHWLYISLHTFGNAPLWLALPLMLGLVAIMAFYPALAGYLFCRFAPSRTAPATLMFFPGVWVLLEWTRGWLASGFPWLAAGYSQTDTSLAGYAPVGGVFLVSAAVAVSAGILASFVLSNKRLLPAGLLLLVWGSAALLRPLDYTETKSAALDVALLQGAVPQDKKWLPEQYAPTLRRYAAMTGQSQSADLVIWPEAAIPALLGSAQGFLDMLWREARERQTALLIGIPRRDEESGQFYNSVVALGSAQQTIYDKRHLVPFGEYFPVPDMVRNWMRLMNLPYSDFAAGAHDQGVLALAGEQLALTICYEDVFGAEQLAAVRNASMLVNVSNDAWFGNSIAPHQHLQIARMRALETRKPMLRATNTGISAFIQADGEISLRSRQFQQEILRARVYGRMGNTPYARSGDWPSVVLSLLLLSAALLAGRYKPV